ncbi:peptidyl-prolyl cis-trans isomerase [Ornithinibacillus sp. BX22]|uniref:peptidylprolyl isomerase n=2 Tax=Ornithinibacillus TaxID=484508 RepID=A0A923L8I2_9BACI|nr:MULTISPECIES: peptidyl-prolyl cis-trans isomerase [Ornithinibacillus]MBC5638428.1 peptidyl-prolyl cis-trans isomerase [Ornithinibacillus hominis]MBS3678598.1 peptidyl-prolyl cis-trans isomerase [Ornithinibacillus massiliensis]
MSNKLLLSVIVVLLITNVATMLLWKNDRSDESIVEDEEVDTQKPVASIGGTEISFQDWMKSLRESYGKKELKTLIDQEVVKKLAQEQNITVSEKVIERDIALLTTMQGLTTEEELKELEENWREDIIYRYQLEAMLAQDVQVPEEDVQAYFTKYDNQYQFSESFQLSHILVANRETANKVYEELEAGASFSLLAKEYSIDEDTRENGGYLGFNSSSTEFIPSNYFDIAKGLEEYTYSEPFVTSNGVAILFLHKKLPDITFSYEELKPYIRNELALQSINQNLVADPLWEKFDIEWVYDE